MIAVKTIIKVRTQVQRHCSVADLHHIDASLCKFLYTGSLSM